MSLVDKYTWYNVNNNDLDNALMSVNFPKYNPTELKEIFLDKREDFEIR